MKHYVWVTIAGLLYLVLSITNPIDTSSNNFGLSEIQLRLLQFTIAFPFLVSWVAGIVGYTELLKFSAHLKDVYEQTAFRRIASGILLLILGSVIPAFIGVIRTRFGLTGPDIQPTITIITNYLYVFLPLIGLSFIHIAASSLARSAKAPDVPEGKIAAWLLFPIGITALNAYLTLTNTTRQLAESGSRASYYLPDVFIVLTLLVPSAITWYVGTLAILDAQNYRHHAKGSIFQSAMSLFIWGLFFIVMASMSLQLLLALGSPRLMMLGLVGILAIVYVFVILQTLGYILIAFASRKFSLVYKILSKYTDQSHYDATSEKT